MISDIICSKENNCFLGKALWANKTQCPGYFYIKFVAVKVTEIQNVFSVMSFTQFDSKRKHCENCGQSKSWLAPPVIFIFFAKSVACPTSSSNSSGGKANSVKIATRWCAAFWFWGWSTCYSLMLTRPDANTKGFVLASLSGAHCGYMPPQLKNKMFIFLRKKKTISVACPTSSSRGETNSAKASPQIKQTRNFHSFKIMSCLQKKLSVCSLSNKQQQRRSKLGANSVKIAVDPKHDLLVRWFLPLGIQMAQV